MSEWLLPVWRRGPFGRVLSNRTLFSPFSSRKAFLLRPASQIYAGLVRPVLSQRGLRISCARPKEQIFRTILVLFLSVVVPKLEILEAFSSKMKKKSVKV